MSRSQIRAAQEARFAPPPHGPQPLVTTRYPAGEPSVYVSPDFQQVGVDTLLNGSSVIGGLQGSFNAPADGDYTRRGDQWTGPIPSFDAPDDRLLYARRYNSWEPAIFAGAFFWSQVFSLTGNEGPSPVPPAPPEWTWMITAESLPAVPFHWTAQGTGVGAVFFSNHGLPPFTYPAGGMANLILSVEDPQGSGNWWDLGGLTPSTQFATPDVFLRATPTGRFSTMWGYDPARDAGIHVGMRIATGGTAGNPYSLIIGLEGQILPLGLNVTRRIP